MGMFQEAEALKERFDFVPTCSRRWPSGATQRAGLAVRR